MHNRNCFLGCKCRKFTAVHPATKHVTTIPANVSSFTIWTWSTVARYCYHLAMSNWCCCGWLLFCFINQTSNDRIHHGNKIILSCFSFPDINGDCSVLSSKKKMWCDNINWFQCGLINLESIKRPAMAVLHLVYHQTLFQKVLDSFCAVRLTNFNSELHANAWEEKIANKDE